MVRSTAGKLQRVGSRTKCLPSFSLTQDPCVVSRGPSRFCGFRCSQDAYPERPPSHPTVCDLLCFPVLNWVEGAGALTSAQDREAQGPEVRRAASSAADRKASPALGGLED